MGLMNNVRNAVSALIGAPGQTVAGLQPLYEVATPQYPSPTPYSLMQNGYRRNEVIYACVNKRANANAEAPLKLYDQKDRRKRKELDDHPLADLVANPNPYMSQAEFWRAISIYVDIAGFSVWEKEYNRLGEVVALWPMRVDWCSFKRDSNRPLAFVQYRIPDMQPMDVPVERCVVFMEFDPLYPSMKGLSRSAVAGRVGMVDNAATDFLSIFFREGAVINGLLKTQQSLQEAQAQLIRRMWTEQHGGANNWSQPAVLGMGVEYQQTQMNFKDMAFSDIDGRNETRICGIFDMSPILINAKVGMGAMTYNNYKEARAAWYDESIGARWSWLAATLKRQLEDDFSDLPETLVVEFDTSEVRALQEDEHQKWLDALMAAKQNVITRDMALEKMGYERMDNADVYVGVTIKGQDSQQDVSVVGGERADTASVELPPAPAQAQLAPPAPIQPIEDVLKAWRRAAVKSIQLYGYVVVMPPSLEGAQVIDMALQSCKSRNQVERVFEQHWPHAPKPAGEDVLLAELTRELRAARLALETA